MSTFRQHCEDCKVQLGAEYPQVHHWLDELFRYFGGAHRAYRHHTEGVEAVRKAWGYMAGEAAKIHILADFPHLKEVPKPEDYKDGWPGEQVVDGKIVTPSQRSTTVVQLPCSEKVAGSSPAAGSSSGLQS